MTSLTGGRARRLLAVVAVVAVICPPRIVAQGGRFVHTPDLGPLIQRVVGPDGIIDSAFTRMVGQPSPWLTDFYGIQVLRDVPRERIRRDLVPAYAEIEAEDEHSLTLRFGSWSAAFYS